MKIVKTFPHRIQHIEHTWIPMSDGIRLAARIWMPVNAEASPVPAIFEYIPYRKRDGVRLRDETFHPYFAGHGYACIRVDIRGSRSLTDLIVRLGFKPMALNWAPLNGILRYLSPNI